MYSYDRVMNGISRYIDTEIVNKVPGWKRWILGSGIGMALSNSEHIFEQLKSNELMKMLNIIDADGYINVEDLYRELKKQAQRGSVDLELPMIGSFVLNEQDVDKLYRFIVND